MKGGKEGEEVNGKNIIKCREVVVVGCRGTLSELSENEEEGKKEAEKTERDRVQSVPRLSPVLAVSFLEPRVMHRSSCHIELQMLLPWRALRPRPFFFILANNLVMKY